MTNAQSSQSPFVLLLLLCHHLLLMEMLNEYTHIRVYIYINKNQCLARNRTPKGHTQQANAKKKENERDGKKWLTFMYAPYLFSFSFRERGRAIRSRIIFDDFPVPYLFLPFQPTHPTHTPKYTPMYLRTFGSLLMRSEVGDEGHHWKNILFSNVGEMYFHLIKRPLVSERGLNCCNQ